MKEESVSAPAPRPLVLDPEVVAVIQALISLLVQVADIVPQLIIQKDGLIMSTLADLNAQLDAISASETAEAAQLTTMGTALTTIITDLHNLPPAGVLTQAELDAAVQHATDVAAAAAANVATTAAESAQATGAVPPTP